MNPALAKYDDAALIAELEARTQRALFKEVIHASDVGTSRLSSWQEKVCVGSSKLLAAIEAAGVRPA